MPSLSWFDSEPHKLVQLFFVNKMYPYVSVQLNRRRPTSEFAMLTRVDSNAWHPANLLHPANMECMKIFQQILVVITLANLAFIPYVARSEERRVGKECRS